MPPEQRRASIVEATLPLLQDLGAGITTRQIAEAAGVAEGTLFRVFASLPELLTATIAHYFSPDRFRAKLAATDFGETLESRTRTAIELIAEDYRAARSMFAAVHFSPHDDAGTALRQQIIERIELFHVTLEEHFGRHRDELTVPPDTYVQLVMTVAHGHGNHLGSPPDLSIETLTHFALHGAAKDPA